MASLPSFLQSGIFQLDPNNMDPRMRDEIAELVLDRLGSSLGAQELSPQQIRDLIADLPHLTEAQVNSLGHHDSVCPICFTALSALLAEEETAAAMDSPAHPVEELGVTRLAQQWQCGHLFCRRCISRWIRDGHGSCPTCRRPFCRRDDSTEAPEPESGRDREETLNNPDPSPLDPHDFVERILGGSIQPMYMASQPDDSRDEYAGMYS